MEFVALRPPLSFLAKEAHSLEPVAQWILGLQLFVLAAVLVAPLFTILFAAVLLHEVAVLAPSLSLCLCWKPDQ